MTYIIGIIIGMFVWFILWKGLGSRVKVPKEQIWGASIAVGLFVTALVFAYKLQMLRDPFAYFTAVILSGLVYISNKTFYKQNMEQKRNKR